MLIENLALPALRVGMRVTIGRGAKVFGGEVCAAATRDGVPHYTVAWDSGAHAPVNGTAVLCLDIVGDDA